MFNKYPHFLSSEIKNTPAEEALFHVIPVPFEKSVSYGGGTKRGPSEILKASSQLEVWDGQSQPCEKGIHTYSPVNVKTPESMIEETKEHVLAVLNQKHIPVLLGGEHTVSVGAFEALSQWDEPVGIVQIDAHADLRDQYEGSPLSHACVMKRAYDLKLPFYQVGVRALSPEEVTLRQEAKLSFIDGRECWEQSITKIILPSEFPKKVYLTLDIDGLDPSLFSETGTPVPGGLGWYQTLSIIESVASQRKLIGFDLVELAPAKGQYAQSYAASELVYKIMGIIERHI
ncbi:agmatinase [Spirochaeta cellobiosiphila]|uniref:agmatinase n=1 Tax=Spirochaeta cellobiosiphila TaxID=504483 RepID=UPI00041ADA50|nr:agmatinase [Spirochaeta cellobiosiphila]